MSTTAKTIPGATPDAAAIALARLGIISGHNDEVTDSDWIDVHFNPASLQLQVSNELKDTTNNERKQYIAKTSAKLTMELQFDTSESGEDVTSTTKRLQAFIAPPNRQDQTQTPPPVVLFEWGRVKFKGIAETYKETIDFFSANGVPLRASVNLTLSRQDQVFDDAPSGAPANAGNMNGDFATDSTASSPADLASAAQAPGAARAVAAANGQENLRFGDGSPLSISASVSLKPPAAFASGGGGFGIGGGLSLGGSIGVGGGIALGGSVNVGGGISLTAGASSGGISIGTSGTSGISGLARLSASEGAFSGLRATAASAPTVRINTARLHPQVRSTTLSTDTNARFDVGGRATLEGGSGLRADVGLRSLRGKLSFEP